MNYLIINFKNKYYYFKYLLSINCNYYEYSLILII